MGQLPEKSAVIMEATGGYERLAATLFDAAGFSVCVTNPI